MDAGTGAYLLRRGDAERGTVIVRLAGKQGTRILTQMRDLEGRLIWMGVKDGMEMSEPDANAYIERAVDRDPDLWVMEVEIHADENPFTGEVVGL